MKIRLTLNIDNAFCGVKYGLDLGLKDMLGLSLTSKWIDKHLEALALLDVCGKLPFKLMAYIAFKLVDKKIPTFVNLAHDIFAKLGGFFCILRVDGVNEVVKSDGGFILCWLIWNQSADP